MRTYRVLCIVGGMTETPEPEIDKLQQAIDAIDEHAAILAEEQKARRRRDDSIRAAIASGVTMYAIAKHGRLTEQGVRRIRDAAKARCDIPGCTVTDPHRHKPQG